MVVEIICGILKLAVVMKNSKQSCENLLYILTDCYVFPPTKKKKKIPMEKRLLIFVVS